MLGADRPGTGPGGSSGPVDHDLQADLATIDTLETEIAGLKGSASEKQAEITRLGKECGLDVKSKVKAKLAPVSDAISSAVEKAKPVLRNAADKVAVKAHELREKMRPASNPAADGEGDDAEAAAAVDSATPSAGAGNTDNPYLVSGSAKAQPASAGTGNLDNPYMNTATPTPKPPPATATAAADPTAAPAPTAGAAVPARNPEDEERRLDDAVEKQKKMDMIEKLKNELQDEKTLIASRESEVAWLYKKHKISQPNALSKFRANVQSSEAYQKTAHNLGVAKEKTRWGLKVAGAKTKSLWQSAGKKASTMSLSTKEWWRQKREGKSSGGAPTSKSAGSRGTSPAAGKDDMYARYS